MPVFPSLLRFMSKILLTESAFHSLADQTLECLADALEPLDQKGALEVDHGGDAVQAELPSGQVFLISKHVPMRQLWLSSPLSGGLHFSFNEADGQWKLEDGRTLFSVLQAELRQLQLEVYW